MSARTSKPAGGLAGGEVKGLTPELEDLAVLCSANAEINADLRGLSARINALEESVDELASADIAELQSERAILSDTLEQLTGNVLDIERTVYEEVDEFRSQQENLEARLDAVELCFSADLSDQQEAYVSAQGREKHFDRGDTHELSIEEVMRGTKPTIRGAIEKVQTFGDVDDRSEYEERAVIQVTITDIRENAASTVEYGG